jgi:FkbM family methyltransferase
MSTRNSAIRLLCAAFSRPSFRSFWSNVSLASRYFEGLGSGSSIERSGELGVIEYVATNPGIPKLFIDVGANKGEYTSRLLAACPSAEVHAFDASPFAVSELERRFKNRGNVRVIGLGLSDKGETLTLRSPTEGAGVASFYEHVGEHIEAFSSTQCITLDEYCEKAGLTEIGLLKVDVEGHELSVLKGALRLLDSGAIHAIQFDGGAAFGSRIFFHDFWTLLRGRNYKISRVLPFGLAHIDEYRERDEVCLPTIYLAERG